MIGILTKGKVDQINVDDTQEIIDLNTYGHVMNYKLTTN